LELNSECGEENMSDRRKLDALDVPSARRQIIVGAALAFGALAANPIAVMAGTEEGISHSAESIHQEPVFKASRKRVYEALTDAKQFNKVVQLSAAMQSMSLGNKPTEISPEVGGAFRLFGGHIVGRHIELVANERIVQAWRVVDWNPGIYSIVKFELTEQGAGTKLVFDHTGFPEGKGQHLADGWKANYWEPLEKYLG
jgi:activator of HSP90 ATPase